MSKIVGESRPVPECKGPHTAIRVKLPLGWERDVENDVLILRLPATSDVNTHAIADALRPKLGEFTEMAMENLYKLSQLRALKDAIVS